MKKLFILIFTITLFLTLTSCGNSNDNTDPVIVVSREEGSGTRGAFISLVGIEEVDEEGNKSDKTIPQAIIGNKADIIMTNVQGNENSIGYISLGALNDNVKILKIDGNEPTEENIANDIYKIARPFNIVYNDDISDLTKDFIDYIMSKEGQEVVSRLYIQVDSNAENYETKNLSGTISVGGSTSVAPLIELLAEEYTYLNSGVTIDVQSLGSTAGVTNTIDKVFDIGLASRDLKDFELDQINALTIAKDGIAVIVNNENSIDNITLDELRKIYVGEILSWSELN